VRFQDAAKDARAVVYAGIQADPLVAHLAGLAAGATYGQRLLARAVMNGESTDPDTWRAIFPTVLGPGAPDHDRAEAILAASLQVAGRGEQARSQYRGAFVEELTQVLVRQRIVATAGAAAGATAESAVRRERRVLFDGVAAEIHPYDLTVEIAGRAEAWDCKWGARGINADVLNQLDDARRNAAAEETALRVGLVVYDVRTSCAVRLAQQTAPKQGTVIVTLETLDALAGRKPR
jgi:hypothetical protein